MKDSSQRRCVRRVVLGIGALAALSFARGQTSAEVLEPIVVSATRTPSAPQTLGTAVDFISADELAREQIGSLAQALGGVAGAPPFASGAPGAVSSLFLRGVNSNQTLFLVDGMRLNDPNADYQVFLGGACVAACDNLEVAHGPQSTLYGGEAVGGVISLAAQRGHGAPTASVAAEAGAFGTVQGALAAQGERGPWAYNVSTRGGHTDNARPNNSFDSATTSLRLDRQLTDRLAIGGTVRWFHGAYADPGDRYTDDPNNEEREDNVLATAFAEVTFADAWNAHFLLGGQDRRFVSDNPEPNPPYASPAQRTLVTNRRAVLDWQNTFTGFERHRITGGFTAEANHTRNTGFGDVNEKQSLLAFFAQDEFAPTDSVFLTAGLRNDDYDTFGRATTGRATAAWLVVPKALKLRASYGTAFRSPSFLDLYGQSAYYVGNPDLKAERARGWDAGADYYLPGRRGVVSATWFETDFRDLIAYDFTVFPATVMNVERARTRGLEVSAQAGFAGVAEGRVSYTYLEADNLTLDARLLRRPRHAFNASAWHVFGGGVSAGAGVTFAAGRQDVDAATFATIDAEDYTVVRLFAAWQVNDRLALKARIENLLDERYEEVNGYPALGFGAFGGVEWKF
ncbi:MAG TPA: TonB-dependent receptor [Opitutus sp.]|nr:TonB-dependent receptor [Opitutus sp.]